jgi:cytochrome c-type biogenesis protein CcmH
MLQLLEGGATEDAILDEFVTEYGKAVLIAPPLEGFNWVGYLTPVMALVMGGVLVGLVLRRSIRSREPQPVGAAVSSDEWERLQSEIRKIEEEEAASDW